MIAAAEEIVGLLEEPLANLAEEIGHHHGLKSPITLPFQLPTPVYGAMLAIWHLRPVLQRRFPLHKGRPKDFVRFLAWCAAEGRRQYAILRAIPDWDAALARPAVVPSLKKDQWDGGMSVATFLLGIARYRYFVAPVLKDAKARNRIMRAYWRGERHKRMLPSPGKWQYDFLADRFCDIEALIAVLRLKGKETEKDASQLTDEFGLDDVAEFLAHPRSNDDPPNSQAGGMLEHHALGPVLPQASGGFYLRLPIQALKRLAWFKERFRRRPSQFQLSAITSRIPTGRRPYACSPKTPYPFGVNLFGYAKGEIGIGEDVRLVALALQSRGIPFCIVDVKPGDSVSQKDESVDHWIVDQPRYAINIFCTTGIEQVRYACERGLEVLEGRYNIGFWPWELPDWPASCVHAFSVVDEIWGISRYTANAYRAAERPVYPMSLPVTIGEVARLSRDDFGLPKDAYLFVFAFDFNSTLIRKNPEAVVKAFQRAFPRKGNEPVGLVLKASHIDPANKGWKRIRRLINGDTRIHVIDKTLRRPEVLALYRCCDCFVSLHRAEGFGRGLAEALLLDRQLIATGFSGNVDFCTEERVGLVRYARVEVARLKYFHADGQSWADPDVEHAAELMRDVFANPRPIRPRAFDFSPETMGARYAERLLQINAEIGNRNKLGVEPV